VVGAGRSCYEPGLKCPHVAASPAFLFFWISIVILNKFSYILIHTALQHNIYADTYIIYLVHRTYTYKYIYNLFIHIRSRLVFNYTHCLIKTDMKFTLWVNDMLKQKSGYFLLNSYYAFTRWEPIPLCFELRRRRSIWIWIIITKLMPINEFVSILFTYYLKINSFSDLRMKVLTSVVCT
jgi:hypothetical protein